MKNWEKTEPLKKPSIFLIRKSMTILSLFKLQKEPGAWTEEKLEAVHLSKLPRTQYESKVRKI